MDFGPTGNLIYPMETSENQSFFDFCKGYRKEPVAWNRLMG